MNYAEDRLDRRARHVDSSGTSGLVADWERGLELLSQEQYDGHELLGKTLRDTGWCRHATFHYAMAWMHNPCSQTAAGHYAQMAELAGFPEVGVLALLHFRAGDDLEEPVSFCKQTNDEQTNPCRDAHSSVKMSSPSTSHCGCGFADCGRYLCYIPMVDLNPIISSLEEYAQQCNDHAGTAPTASVLLASLAKDEQPVLEKTTNALLQFWNISYYRPLEPVLQLLLVKLLYVTVPYLAAEAVVCLRFDNPRELAERYKSHWAYYVLIRAVVLGERIKPHRRQSIPYHVPVWDRLFDLDRRLVKDVDNPIAQESETTDDSMWDHLNDCIANCRELDSDHTTLQQQQEHLLTKWWYWPPNALNHPPIFIMGDSHVLSLAWQTLFIPSPRLSVPVVTTGLKAWHTKADTRFFTRYLLTMCLDRLPATCRTILFSAGEIDCREGIGGKRLEGYNTDCHEQIRRSVSEYVGALSCIAKQRQLQILVLPVAPHAHRSQRNGKSKGRAFRRHAMEMWNQQLREMLPFGSVYMIDYERDLRQEQSRQYVLKPEYNADYTHMNSAFLPHLEQALQLSGCDVSLI